jgi:hypothetical protein
VKRSQDSCSCLSLFPFLYFLVKFISIIIMKRGREGVLKHTENGWDLFNVIKLNLIKPNSQNKVFCFLKIFLVLKI